MTANRSTIFAAAHAFARQLVATTPATYKQAFALGLRREYEAVKSAKAAAENKVELWVVDGEQELMTFEQALATVPERSRKNVKREMTHYGLRITWMGHAFARLAA